MSAFYFKPRQANRQKAAALVIVLAFLVLLTGLVVAYFSRTVTTRQLSNTSFNQTKASQLALSASDLLIGDLKQEIVSGSSPTPSPNVGLYVPTVNTNMVPQRSGTPVGGATPIPNLVRRSVRSDPIAAPGVGSRASAVNSQTDPSVTGRAVSAARWNSHYLVPRLNQSLTTIDSTPVASFTAPDWVIVTNTGPKQFNAWDATLKDNTNSNYAVGRYAYAVYDEGGLLDANVAGFPSPTPTATPSSAYKSNVALADLTQMPTSLALPTPTFPPTQINNIVGWRNYATAQPGGTFSTNFTFDSAAAARYLTAVLTNTTGFRKVATTLWNNRTDQQFATRQQLLAFRRATGFSQNVLQYLTTFSRTLDQPSFIPNPNRPKVVSNAPASAPAATLSTYGGGNDAYGSEDAINPSFLTIRVGTSFTRLDGSTSVVGEPLVKRRFALSNLSRITRTSTATNTSSDPIYSRFGIYRTSASSPWIYDHGGTNRILRLSEVQALTGANAREPDFAELLKAAINVGSLAKASPNGETTGVYQYVRDSSVDLNILQIMANLIDQYDSDSYPTSIQMGAAATASGKVSGIEDLPYLYRFRPFVVVTQNPNPLLTTKDKVIFHGQAFTYSNPAPGGSATGDATVVRAQYSITGLASAGEAALLYIPEVWNPHDANTRLVSNTDRPTKFRVTLSSSDPNGGSQTSITGKLVKTDTASGSNYVYSSPVPSPTPTGFTNPSIPSAASFPSPNPTPAVPLTRDNTSVEFADAGGALLREPTMLWRPTAPAGSNVVPGSSPATQFYTKYGNSLTDVNTSQQYVGLLASYSPISWVGAVSDLTGATSIDRNGVTTTAPPGTNSFIFEGTDLDVSNFNNITFRVEYYDSNSSTWIPYDEKYVNTHNVGPANIIVNVKDSSGNNIDYNWFGATTKPDDKNPFLNGSLELAGTAPDPRTSRFSMSSTDPNYPSATDPGVSDPLLEVSAANVTVAGNTAMGSTLWTTTKTQRPMISGTTAPASAATQGQYDNYAVPGDGGSYNSAFMPVSKLRWFTSNHYYNGSSTDSTYYLGGLLSQNNYQMRALARDNATALKFFYEDADGIARRGMSADSPLDANGITTSPIGIPLVTSGDGTGTVTAQSQSRPIVLNRPFRSVAEMAYASRGAPWKQIDFSTPESGDTALLNVFSLNESPFDAIVAGKVNLNTRQVPVLKALFSGAYRDEFANLGATLSPTPQPALTKTEAQSLATALVATTTGTQTWQGPLTNISDVVGHYVNSGPLTVSGTDVYQYARPTNLSSLPTTTYTYGGFTGSLGAAGVWDSTYTASSQYIQRFRESAVRPLVDCGQTRTWNLLIDVVAQSGRYPSSATTLPQFFVEGEKRYWVHVAIDRLTGEVIDKQVEMVTE